MLKKRVMQLYLCSCLAAGIMFLPMQVLASKLEDAEKSYRKGDYENSLKSANEAIQEDENNVKAHKVALKCYDKLGRIGAALTKYTKLLIEKKNSAVYNYAVGYIYDLKKNTDRAIEGYDKALSLNSKLPLANYNLAWIYEDKGDFSKAIEYYQKEISNNPGDVAGYNNLSRLYLKMKHYEKALETAQTFLSANINNKMAYDLIGEAYYGMGDNEKALDEWKKTVDLDQKDVQAGIYNVHGVIFDAKGYYNSAMKEYRKGIEGSANTRLYYNLGMSYMHKVQEKTFGKKNDKWYNEAVKEFQNALKDNPKFGEAYVGLGDAYFGLGLNDLGIAQYEKYMEINPRDVDGLNRLGNAYRRLGRYKDAVVQFNKVLAIENNNAEAYRNLGFAYYYQGLQDAAKAQWEKSLKIEPNQPLLREQINSAFKKF